MTVLPVLLFSQTSPAKPQLKEIKEISTQAVGLQKEGGWPEARDTLLEGLQQCQTGSEGRDCRLLLNYSLGYVHEQQSRVAKDDSRQLLRQSAHYYEQALSERPSHGPTLSNLALVYARLEPTEATEAFLQRAIELDPSRSGTYSLLLGDYYRKRESWRKALEAYRQAAETTTDGESVRHRIAGVYANLELGALPELLEASRNWRVRFPEAAAHGYETIMARAYQDDALLAEKALVDWVELLAEKRWLALEKLSALPSGWQTPSVQGLLEYLNSPCSLPGSGNWWVQETKREHVLALAALAAGREELVRGRHDRASKCWEVGTQVSPRYEEYAWRLHESRLVRLDLQTELIVLYFKYPDLDSNETKLRRIEEDLFGGKTFAYELGDLPAIQRHHTVLGTLYAQKGTWTSGNFARNAMFQLSSALKTAAKRQRETGLYQPLPRLKALLGDGYTAARQFGRARSAYLEASQAYMDTDDLKGAQETLSLSAEVEGTETPEQEKQRSDLLQILHLRLQIQDPATTTSGDLTSLVPSPENTPWLYDAPSARLPEEFLKRQRFKISSDVAVAAYKQDGLTPLALDNASQSFNSAIDGQVTLVGTGDFVRLQRTSEISTDATKFGKAALDITLTPPPVGTGGRVLNFSLPTDSRPAYIQVDDSSIEAGKITEQLGGRTVLSARHAALKSEEASETALRDYLQGRYYWNKGGPTDLEKSIVYFENAIKEQPHFSLPWVGLADSYMVRADQDFGKAVEEAKRARDLNPKSPLVNYNLASTYLCAGQYDQAVQQAKSTLESQPDLLVAHDVLEKAYWQLGNYEEALRALEARETKSGTSNKELKALRQLFKDEGPQKILRWKLEKLEQRSKQGYVSPYEMAELYAALGEKNEALAWLGKAHQERSPGLSHVKCEPAFGALRDDTAYKNLLRDMNQREFRPPE